MPANATTDSACKIDASERAAAHYWKVIGFLNIEQLNTGNLHNLLQEIRIVRAQDFQQEQLLDAHDALIGLLQCSQR